MAPCRIEMTRSGGVAGVQLRSAIDTAALAPDDATEIEAMLGKVDLNEWTSGNTRRGGPPDRFQYDLVIEQDGRRHELTIGERDVSPSLRVLLDRLVEEARRRP